MTKPMLPFKRPLLEQTNTSAAASSSGSKEGSRGGQDGLTSYNVPMRRLQLNNNNTHFSKDGALQSSVKKDFLLQRTSSYNRDREFALAFCKQLNENLKVGKAMLHPGSPRQRSPLPPSTVSKPPPERRASLEPQDEGSIPSMEQDIQCSDSKVDRLLNGDYNSSALNPDSSHQVREGGTSSQEATTPAGRLSLKRRRESSTEGKRDGKRLCEEDSCITPACVSFSSSAGAHNINSPPKYVRSAILKRSKETGCLMLEDRTKVSSSLARQLFEEPSRETRSESSKHKSATQPTNNSKTSHLKREIKISTESKCREGCSEPAGSSTSLSAKVNPKCSDERNDLSGLMDEIKIDSPPTPLGSKNDELKTPKLDPDASPRDDLPFIPAKSDAEEKLGIIWNDSLDSELGYDVASGLESVLSLSSSDSSEEEQLLSLQEILARSAQVPTTPDKGAFSEPSTPVPKDAPMDGERKVLSYKNTLEQMLKEKEQNQKSKELEMQLLQTCKENLIKLDEDEANENAEAALSHEQREFLQRFSVTSCAIRDIHPGEEVFTLTNFGRLFSHQNLDLRKISVTPNNRAQRILLQAPTDHVLLLLSAGLFRRAYSTSPCQPQVTRWLFQMMSVHPNLGTCAQILESMTTIALYAAQHIVENSSKKFEVWVPSIKDVALVFLNMGVSFVNLFPLEGLQPTFTEGDLLESLEIKPDETRLKKQCDAFPEHNFENIVKYLALCAALCPRAYTDEELLLLLTLVCKVSLETCLQLLPTKDLSCLLQHILNNMTHWEIQLAQVCQAITDLTEDHHNLRRLVQILPYSDRGKQLRRHLSVSIISKLLNHHCTYKPLHIEFQLSDLRGYLPRMRPSTLLKSFIAAQNDQQEAENCASTPDQQAYYLCYSLLALTNEASNFEFLPSSQRNELLLLSAELEKHIKCDIRESEKMLYRSKVKDFVARIYTRWQVLLQRSRPQEGKLYDYWKPLPEDEIPINEEIPSTEHETTGEPRSEDSDSTKSEEEMDEVHVKSEEELKEDFAENGLLQDLLTDTKLEDLEDKYGKEQEKYNTPVDEELLGGGSPEDPMESDFAEELVTREEELLKDEETPEKYGDDEEVK